MSKKLPTVWDCPPHTLVKHKILEGYLGGWFPILASWNDRIVYIDGFAGPGRYTGGESGSPIIAIQRYLEAKEKGRLKGDAFFIFVEADAKRCEVLRQEVAAVAGSSVRYEIECKPYAEVMDGIWKMLDEAKAMLRPTFAFIDPFGFSHTPFAHTRRLLSNPATEVLFTCMYGDVNRFLGVTEMEGHFDGFFEDKDWRRLRSITAPDERKAAFLEYFRKRLLDAGAKYVIPFEMKDAANSTQYFLLFATKSIKGLKVMKSAMYAADKTGGYTFSDYTDARGPTLLVASPNYPALQRLLLERYSKQSDVRIEDIEEFVLAQTSFLYYKKEALAVLEEAGKITASKRNGKHRKGTFPDGTLVTFL
jgi:three-Cys-motif partner protein